MRFLAFALLAVAAFDWPLPWLDRPGAAALGIACLALAVPAGGMRRYRRARIDLPPEQSELPDATDGATSGVLSRLAPYSLTKDRQ